MDAPEKIPLDEAVARDLIPCSVCGAKGADVRQVEGKKHFLCPACVTRGRRWMWGILIALVGVLGVFLYIRLRATDAAPDGMIDLNSKEQREAFEKTVKELMSQKKYRDALSQLGGALSVLPQDPTLNLYMGQCCFNLGYFGMSVRFYQGAMAAEPKLQKECRASIGQALQYLGHSSQALPFLEEWVEGSPPRDNRRALLAECYLDLERYADALKQLEPFPPEDVILRHRHRALLYMGKPEEARKVFEDAKSEGPTASRTTRTRAIVLAMQAREAGEFAPALKILEEALEKLDAKSVDALNVRHMRFQVYVDEGDLAKLRGEAEELEKVSNRPLAGEAMYYHALGLLLEAKRDEAVAVAKEFLQSVDLEAAFLRSEALMMQHLVGARKSEQLADEAAQVNRFRANDIYFYLALATGDKKWAAKALESTPGHNFPYHAIQRLLQD